MQKEIRCKDCNRYLGTAYGTVVMEMKCSNSSCKSVNQIKVVSADFGHDLRYKFSTPPATKDKKES